MPSIDKFVLKQCNDFSNKNASATKGEDIQADSRCRSKEVKKQSMTSTTTTHINLLVYANVVTDILIKFKQFLILQLFKIEEYFCCHPVCGVQSGIFCWELGREKKVVVMSLVID